MLTDALLQLSSAQTVTASAVSTNTVDLSQARDLGPGKDLYVAITVDEAATAAGAATVNFQVITSAAANLGSPTIIGQTDAIGKAELTLGRRAIIVPIPAAVLLAQPIGQRYLGVQYTVGTGPLLTGKFSAAIVDANISINKLYPSGFSVV